MIHWFIILLGIIFLTMSISNPFFKLSVGKIIKNLSPSTKKHMLGRRSIYVSNNIKKGGTLTKNNIKVVRPSFSMHPKKFNQIIGKRVKRSLKIGDRILEKYLL